MDSDFRVGTIKAVNDVSKIGDVQSEWMENIKVCEVPIQFKLDTGAETNIVPLKVLKAVCLRVDVKHTNVKLEAFGGFKITPVGEFNAELKYRNKSCNANMIVVDCNRDVAPILGLDTCNKLNLIKRVHPVGQYGNLTEFLARNADVFSGIGSFPDICSLQVRRDAIPISCPARRVPFNLKDRLKCTLDSLVEKKIIEPVSIPGDWVNNLVIVEKPDKSLRLCIDPQQLNKYLVRNYFEIPTREEISLKLANKKYFCTFDLKQGFHQVILDAASSQLCAFSTPFGIFRYCRAPFGLSVLPEIFQKLTTKYFGAIEGVTVYFDDILCAAESEDELSKIVQQVVDVARKNNIKFNPDKIQYFVKEVRYLGFIFNEFGHKPDNERIRAIQQLKAPKNIKELQSLLGMINYLRHLLPNIAAVISPLRELLKKDICWFWASKHEKALAEIKSMVANVTILAPFDPKNKIDIHADASKDAIGCALFQNNRPILFASRSLTETECQYAQIEKELLAIVYAFQKFHNFVYGHTEVSVWTDHAPLTSIINKDLNKIQNNRLRRLRLKLFNYKFNLKYLRGRDMVVADLLSRNCKSEKVAEDITMADVIHTVGAKINFSEIEFERFVDQTRKDPALEKILLYYENGWPQRCDPAAHYELLHYFKHQGSITVNENLVYLDNRLLVPLSLRKYVIKLLHETHLGLEKVKDNLKKFFYWPGALSDIKNVITSCATCQRFQRSKIKEPLLPHDIPDIPFYKVGIDIAEYAGNYFLVLMDYYSRWLEIERLNDKSSSSVINVLKPLFARWGIPRIVIADNNPFGSYEFKKFASDWKFETQTISPHYSQSNGLAEKAVGIAKNMLKKCSIESQDFNLYLLNYRNSPVAGFSYSPSQLLMSRILRTKLPIQNLDLLKPVAIQDPAVTQKEKQIKYYNQSCKKEETFQEQERVLVQNVFSKIWETGEIVKKLDYRSYMVKVNGRIYRRNSMFLRKCVNPGRYVDSYMWGDENEEDKGNRSSEEHRVGSDGPPAPSQATQQGLYTTRYGRVVRPRVMEGCS